LKIPINLQGRVASAFNPTTQEAKAKGLEAWSQPGLHSDLALKTKKKTIKKKKLYPGFGNPLGHDSVKQDGSAIKKC
jgi:hypothetical protein